MLAHVQPIKNLLLSTSRTYVHVQAVPSVTRRLLNTSTMMSFNSNNANNYNDKTLSSNTGETTKQRTSEAPVKPKRWSRHIISTESKLGESIPAPQKSSSEAAADEQPKQRRKRRTLKPLKAPITLTENAKVHLRALNKGPNPKLIRISVRNRGCSGLTYHLEYVDKPDKFDEVIKSEDITVVIDSKALFSIIGSEMDWVDNKLSSKFVFKNPNSKGTCGCGESFMV